MSHEEKSPFNNIWSVQNFPNNNSRLGFNSGNNKFMRNKKGHDQVENSKGSIASSAKLKETMLCLAYSRWSLLVKTNKESGLEFKVKLNLMLKKWHYTRRIKIKLAKSKNQRGEHLFLYTWWWEGAHIYSSCTKGTSSKSSIANDGYFLGSRRMAMCLPCKFVGV
jgi:hypothetical protein